MREQAPFDWRVNVLRFASAAWRRLDRAVLGDGGDMQSRKLRNRFVVAENEYTAGGWRHGGVICRWDGVLSAVARSNREWNEWGGVQEIANSGNHDSIVIEESPSLKQPTT